MILLKLTILFFTFCYSKANIFNATKFEIFHGFNIIQIDICQTQDQFEQCQLYGCIISKKSPITTGTTASPSEKFDLNYFTRFDPDLYSRMTDTSPDKFYHIMNYISFMGNYFDRPNVNYNEEINNTIHLMQTVRFVQWNINIPIAKMFEELINGVKNVYNKNGFYMFLLKFFKISNADLLYYCKFQSDDSCFKMYEGINTDLTINNIIYDECILNDNLQSSSMVLNKTKKFFKLCANDQFMDLSPYSKIIGENNIGFSRTFIKKTSKRQHFTTYSYMKYIFNRTSRNDSGIEDLKFEDDSDIYPNLYRHSESYLKDILWIVNHFDINLFNSVLSPVERLNSSEMGSIHWSRINFRINVLSQLICKNDISACIIDNSRMNVKLNSDFIYYWKLRIDPTTLQKSIGSLLFFENINSRDVIFNRLIYLNRTKFQTKSTLVEKKSKILKSSWSGSYFDFKYFYENNSWPWVVVLIIVGITFIVIGTLSFIMFRACILYSNNNNNNNTSKDSSKSLEEHILKRSIVRQQSEPPISTLINFNEINKLNENYEHTTSQSLPTSPIPLRAKINDINTSMSDYTYDRIPELNYTSSFKKSTSTRIFPIKEKKEDDCSSLGSHDYLPMQSTSNQFRVSIDNKSIVSNSSTAQNYIKDSEIVTIQTHHIQPSNKTGMSKFFVNKSNGNTPNPTPTNSLKKPTIGPITELKTPQLLNKINKSIGRSSSNTNMTRNSIDDLLNDLTSSISSSPPAPPPIPAKPRPNDNISLPKPKVDRAKKPLIPITSPVAARKINEKIKLLPSIYSLEMQK